MNPFRRANRRRALAALAAAAVAVTAAAVLSGFHTSLHEITPPGSKQTSELTTAQVVGIRTWTPTADVSVTSDVTYGTADDGARLDLDVCSPKAAAAPGELRRGILSIHGGSWARGDKANTDWRDVCEWLASEGFVAFSVNYRLAPAALFPAGIDDVTAAAVWVRDHAADYGIDPGLIGAFGGSAGGNLAALLGMRGSGALDTGSRVAAVAELSGPVDITVDGLASASPLVHQIAQNYLGCADLASCPQARRASATTFVDPSDPPVFIGHSESEFIPLNESQEFAAKLEAAGVQHHLVVVPGVNHSIGTLDASMRAQVADFFRSTLGGPAAPADPAPATPAGPADGSVSAAP